ADSEREIEKLSRTVFGGVKHLPGGGQKRRRNQEGSAVASKDEWEFNVAGGIEQANDGHGPQDIDVLVFAGFDGGGGVHHIRDDDVPSTRRRSEVRSHSDIAVIFQERQVLEKVVVGISIRHRSGL